MVIVKTTFSIGQQFAITVKCVQFQNLMPFQNLIIYCCCQVHVSEVGIVLRALGYNPQQELLDDLKRNTPQQTLSFQEFLECVDQVKSTQRSSPSVDLGKVFIFMI